MALTSALTHVHDPVVLERIHHGRRVSVPLVAVPQPPVGAPAPAEHLPAGGQGDHVVGPARHLLYVPRGQRAKHSD